MNSKSDSGVYARLLGMAPDLAPIIMDLVIKRSYVGECEHALRKIEDVFQARYRVLIDSILPHKEVLPTLIGISPALDKEITEALKE